VRIAGFTGALNTHITCELGNVGNALAPTEDIGITGEEYKKGHPNVEKENVRKGHISSEFLL